MYLAHDPGRRYGAEAVYKKRCGSIDLGIPAGSGRGIKVFEVIPESVWDPTQFLLLDPSTPVALLLGDPKEPYGSVYLLVLKHRTAGTLYLVPASSRAIPYIMTNLGNLTQQTLLAFFNLEPVQLDRLEIKTRPHNHLFQGEDLSAGGLRFDLLALFREVQSATQGPYGQGTPFLQLSGLSIRDASSRSDGSVPQPLTDQIGGRRGMGLGVLTLSIPP